MYSIFTGPACEGKAGREYDLTNRIVLNFNLLVIIEHPFEHFDFNVFPFLWSQGGPVTHSYYHEYNKCSGTCKLLDALHPDHLGDIWIPRILFYLFMKVMSIKNSS
jgi:hypothetical protein